MPKYTKKWTVGEQMQTAPSVAYANGYRTTKIKRKTRKSMSLFMSTKNVIVIMAILNGFPVVIITDR